MPSPFILLVDDDPRQLELFSLLLRDLPYPIVRAQGGDEGLAILQKDIPILVILDVAMPHVTGLEVLQSIRADKRLNSIKVIMLTVLPERIQGQYAAMADRIVAKPYVSPQLEQTVRELLAVEK